MPRLLEHNYISPLKLVTSAASVLNHCIVWFQGPSGKPLYRVMGPLLCL